MEVLVFYIVVNILGLWRYQDWLYINADDHILSYITNVIVAEYNAILSAAPYKFNKNALDSASLVGAIITVEGWVSRLSFPLLYSTGSALVNPLLTRWSCHWVLPKEFDLPPKSVGASQPYIPWVQGSFLTSPVPELFFPFSFGIWITKLWSFHCLLGLDHIFLRTLLDLLNH